MEQNQNNDDAKFVIQVGHEVKKIIISALNKKYSGDPLKMKDMFMNTMINCFVNIIGDVSTSEEGLRHNLKIMTNTLDKFLDQDLEKVSYNTSTDEIIGVQ